MSFPPIVERLARAFANNHLEHVGGADGDTLVAGTPNWHFFTRDAESAALIFKEIEMTEAEKIELRKWCVEQAISFHRNNPIGKAVDIAKEIHGWVTQEDEPKQATLRPSAAL